MLLSQALTVLTLVVAGLIVVPAGALAHEGHIHTVPPATVVKQAADIQVFDAARITLQDVVACTRTSGASVAVFPVHGQKAPQSCPGGCCHSWGAGCCPAWLTASFEMRIPVLGRSTLVVAVIGGSGITPDALPEPPKSSV